MPFRRTRKEYLHSCAEKILLFHSHISFYVHVKTPSPAKTASFLISTGARSSASCNILFSPESVHRREPAGRRHRNQGHKANPSAYPDHRCRSRTRQKQPSLHVCKYLILTVQALPPPSRRTSQALPPAPLSAAHAPNPHRSAHHSSSMRHGSTPAPHRSTGCSCATYAPGTP